jgi:DNA-binding NarL/FixJ family response regulator
MKHARSTNKNPKCAPPDAKRIVIVDDHPLFRKGLEQLIHSDGAFAVCGEAGNAPEAMDVIRKLDPDLVIVDLSLPGANGIELIKTFALSFRNSRFWCSRCMMNRSMHCGRFAPGLKAMS